MKAIILGISKKKLKAGKIPKVDSDLPPLLAKINYIIYVSIAHSYNSIQLLLSIPYIQVFGFNPRQRKMRWGVPFPDAYTSRWRSKELASIPKKCLSVSVFQYTIAVLMPTCLCAICVSRRMVKRRHFLMGYLKKISLDRTYSQRLVLYD